jgi:hypothetical protein
MCLVCSQIGCRGTEHTATLSIRVGPLGLLDAVLSEASYEL